MKQRGSILADILGGALAGAAATWILDQTTSILYERESKEAREREDEARGGQSAYGVAADKAAAVVGRQLDDEQRQRYGTMIHWATGIGAGAVYGALRRRTPWASAGFGALYGLLFWLVVDEGANTVLRLTPPPGEFPWQSHARGAAGHVAYGVATEAAMQVAESV